MSPDEITDLLISAAKNRRRLALAMLRANAANALPNPLSDEDVAHWKSELLDSEADLADLGHVHSE